MPISKMTTQFLSSLHCENKLMEEPEFSTLATFYHWTKEHLNDLKQPSSQKS